MNKVIERNYLEINSLTDLNDSNFLPEGYLIQLIDPPDFQLNRFFYKNVGKNHHWVDRLSCSEKQWIKYTSDEKTKTYVLRTKNDLVG